MTATQVFRLNNLTGGINSSAEENALVSFASGTGLQAEARDIENFMPLNRGGQSKAYGYTLFKAVGSSPITGLYRYIKSDGTNLFLVSSGTQLYKLLNGVLTNLGATLSLNAYIHFETALDDCIICDGVQHPLVFDGNTISTLGGSPPTGARQSLFYQNRLWIFGGTADPSLLYYSNPNDINNGYTTQFVQCDVNDGQKITAIGKFYLPGDLEPIIIVGKERSVGIITGDGTTSSPYTFAKINFDFGIPGFRQIVQFGQNIGYLTPDGVASYGAWDGQAKMLYQYLSEKVRNKFQALEQSTLKNALCWLDWKNTRISFAVAELNSAYPNVVWHYDVRLGCWYKERFGNISATLIDTDGTWYHGDDVGNLYVHSDTYTDFNGSAINAYYTTPYLDFGNPNVKKRILDARITARSQGNYSLGISSKLDYGTRIGKSNTITLTAGSYMWNDGTWTSNINTYQWGAAPIKIKRFIPSGYFNNIQFNFSQSGANQPIDIFEIEFTVEFEDFR